MGSERENTLQVIDVADSNHFAGYMATGETFGLDAVLERAAVARQWSALGSLLGSLLGLGGAVRRTVGWGLIVVL